MFLLRTRAQPSSPPLPHPPQPRHPNDHNHHQRNSRGFPISFISLKPTTRDPPLPPLPLGPPPPGPLSGGLRAWPLDTYAWPAPGSIRVRSSSMAALTRPVRKAMRLIHQPGLSTTLPGCVWGWVGVVVAVGGVGGVDGKAALQRSTRASAHRRFRRHTAVAPLLLHVWFQQLLQVHHKRTISDVRHGCCYLERPRRRANSAELRVLTPLPLSLRTASPTRTYHWLIH